MARQYVMTAQRMKQQKMLNQKARRAVLRGNKGVGSDLFNCIATDARDEAH